jgi:hypothetical protein
MNERLQCHIHRSTETGHQQCRMKEPLEMKVAIWCTTKDRYEWNRSKQKIDQRQQPMYYTENNEFGTIMTTMSSHCSTLKKKNCISLSFSQEAMFQLSHNSSINGMHAHW